MRKKSGFTIVEQAIALVPEFATVVSKLDQQVTLRGQSKSTLNNYLNGKTENKTSLIYLKNYI